MVRKKTNFLGSICSSNIFYTTESRSQVDSCGRCLESILQSQRKQDVSLNLVEIVMNQC